MTCAAFTRDSDLVATGDMSGVIKAWKVSTGEEVWSFQIEDLEVGIAGNKLFWPFQVKDFMVPIIASGRSRQYCDHLHCLQ